MGQNELLALLRPTMRSRENEASGVALAEAVARGLPREAIERVKDALALTDAEIAAAVGMSSKSISRLRTGPRHALNLVASDRLYRLARIYSLAKDVLEDDQLAREWLRRPQIGLGNRTPLSLLVTEAGAREVEDLLGRIEYGVVS